MAGADYVRIFVIEDVAQTYRLLLEIELLAAARARNTRLTAADRRGGSATRASVAAIRRQLSQELDTLARATAKDADVKIKKALRIKRPPSGNTNGILRNVRSYPLGALHGFATGAVGVASVAWLAKAHNPLDAKQRPYWEALEYGTNANVGRRIRGWFFDSHAGYEDPEKPRAVYRNVANPPHGVFVPGAKAQALGLMGGKGGKGEIHTPLRAKHFIRDGANAALADWQTGLSSIQTATLAELARIVP